MLHTWSYVVGVQSNYSSIYLCKLTSVTGIINAVIISVYHTLNIIPQHPHETKKHGQFTA